MRLISIDALFENRDEKILRTFLKKNYQRRTILKNWYSIWHGNVVLDKSIIIKPGIMKKYTNKMVVFLAVTIGTVIGVFKGEEAKQKWVFKMRTKYDNRRLMAERRSVARKGGVLLDDIELASFHNN